MNIGKQLREGAEIDNILFIIGGVGALFLRDRWNDQVAGWILTVALIGGGVTRWVIPGFRNPGLALIGLAFLAAGIVALVRLGWNLPGLVLLPVGIWMVWGAVTEMRAKPNNEDPGGAPPPG